MIPVYRDAVRAINLISALRSQELPLDAECEVIVVDDGSGDDTPDKIEAASGGSARLLRLATNHGRGRALNRCVSEANGDAILFLDSDCLPSDARLLAQHLINLAPTAVASSGPIVGDGSGFWHRYQSEVAKTRERRHAAGIQYSATSTNLMVSRWAFEAIGGFNEAYASYGFEDRDLQLRLLALGPITWTPHAVVRHMDSLSLRAISRKMQEAGERSSTQFALDYPDAYRALGYAAADPRLRPWLRIPAAFARQAAAPLATLGDSIVDSKLVPYAVKRMCVRGATGLSYVAGASRAPALDLDA
ncbi:glycosyltransferase family 2 protein [Luteimonas sp. A501]